MAVERVTLVTYNGPRYVEADRYGPFAIHRELRSVGTGKSFTLSHAATGYAVATVTTKPLAVKLARRLCAARLNWRFTNPARVPKHTKGRAVAIVTAFNLET